MNLDNINLDNINLDNNIVGKANCSYFERYLCKQCLKCY